MAKLDSDDDTFRRVMQEISRKEEGRGREVQWLADRLQVKIQRVQNWKTRGVPPSAVADIAAALGWTMNQVLGLQESPPGWPFETIAPERLARLTPRQAAIVELVVLRELERIEASGKRDGSIG